MLSFAELKKSDQKKPRVVLGLNVYRLRKRAKLTQEQLSEKAKIDRRYVQRIENGTANPGVDVMTRLMQALKANWSEMLRHIQ